MKLVQFEPEHVAQMPNLGGQDHLISCFSPEILLQMKINGPCFTGVLRDGTIAGCAGFVEMNQYRALVWAIFRKTSPAVFLQTHLAVRKVFRQVKYKRLEAFVDPKFYNALRWVEALGFRLNQPYIPFYFPDGSGASEWILYKD